MHTIQSVSRTNMLIAHGYAPEISLETPAGAPDLASVGTVMANLAYYGVTLDARGATALMGCSLPVLRAWWADVEKALMDLSFDNRNMADFVVYKNFPAEVLDMDQSTYWINQILMYVGLPNDLFAEPREARPAMLEKISLRVLMLANPNTPVEIAGKLLAKRADWTETDIAHIGTLIELGAIRCADFSAIESRANAARLAERLLRTDMNAAIRPNAPTDALRIAAAWSAGDPGLRTRTRLAKMPRPLRRRFINMLNGFSQDALVDDMGARPGAWKPFLHALHAGATKGTLALAAARLRSGDFKTDNALLEQALKDRDDVALVLLADRPGVFMRRLHQAISIFGTNAARAFIQNKVLDALTIEQLLGIDAYVANANARTRYLISPNGKMSKAQVVENTKAPIDATSAAWIEAGVHTAIMGRLGRLYPEGFNVDPSAARIGLPKNGQESNVARGTVFPIPEDMTFLRTASYWTIEGSYANTWFDNGWTFFDADWNQVGATTWDNVEFRDDANKKAAIFSGDPTNSKDLKGRACQMIDLYFDRLQQSKAAYAVWTVLCYSGIPFGQADEVLATLQWGENPEAGKLYEPSRAQVRLKLGGKDMAKAVAVLDIAKRELVFLDANLPLRTGSANRNSDGFKKWMPALMETIEAAPTVATLFAHGVKGSIPITYSDADAPVVGKGVVFNPVNTASDVTPLPLEDILQQKGHLDQD